MRPYWGFFRTRFRALLAYRAAAAAGVCTQWLFGMVRVLVLWAFYQTDGAQPMSFAQAATYTWLSQAMLGMFPWNVEPEIGASVRTGQVAYELSRPLDLYAMWWARCLALRTAPTILRALPQFLISALLVPAPFGLIWPGAGQFGAWLLATLGALLLSCALTNILHVALFWTVSGEGIAQMLPLLVMLLSGMLVPLRLFPDAVQTILRYQPFAGLVDGPAQLFAGAMAISELPRLLGLQIIWTLAFVALGRYLMRRGLARVAVAGG